MRNIYINIIILLCCFEIANGQTIHIKKKCANPNDTLIIRLSNYVGDLQWQASSDSINWADIDQATHDTLLIVAEDNKWLRVLAFTEKCEPFVSDMLKIIVKPIVYDSVVDIDGNSYKTITLGKQVWMAENLRVTRYADGELIPLVTDSIEWAELEDNNTDRAYCWYLNDRAKYSKPYGALYTWAAATNGESDKTKQNGVQGACPTGWHIPSYAEWIELEDYLIAYGYNFDASTIDDKVGKSLATTTGWDYDSTPGSVGNDRQSNNTSGFSAFPSRSRDFVYGYFETWSTSCHWWCSTVEDDHEYSAYSQSLLNYYHGLVIDQSFKSTGFAIRCIKDRAE